MADKRINALATTAPNTASDDFFAVDGTTNGTRKLNAFSPTFGGNATVTGNLTVNGTGNSSFAGQLIQVADPATISLWKDATPTKAARFQFNTLADNGFSLGVYDGSSWFNAITVAPTTGVVKVPSTSASTSTSTGALVVGNGTSGGLGVGGAIYAGGAINSDSNVIAARATIGRGDVGSPGAIGLVSLLDVSGGIGRLQVYNFTTSTVGALNIQSNGGALGIGSTSTVTTINGTTASTSTSSGALVVSGGVGVAKRIHSGEGLTVSADSDTQISFIRNGTISIGPTSAATPKLAVGGGLQLSNTSQSISAWGDVGAQLSVAGAVLTDTSSSGTVGRIVTNSIAASALAASSTTTYTAAASLFIAGAPTANTNVTITNAYALYTAGGRINFQGLPTSSAGLQAGTLWNDAGTLKVA